MPSEACVAEERRRGGGEEERGEGASRNMSAAEKWGQDSDTEPKAPPLRDSTGMRRRRQETVPWFTGKAEFLGLMALCETPAAIHKASQALDRERGRGEGDGGAGGREGGR